MTGFSQSALLQALGWATLNSFWQAGALWCTYLLVRRFLVISPSQQYKLAVSLLFLSLTAFFSSILFYLQGGARISGPFFIPGNAGRSWFSAALTAASCSYLILFLVPVTRLVRDWRLLRRLRHNQLAKAPVQYRLFVQKITGHLGIRKNVQVHLSALVQSPLTIGFLKPIILLPVASFNQLTIQQAEAILLHELAHIRRLDYLVNISISLIETLLYFNPFIHFFVRVAENSREACCDKLVLQFDYDPFAYASALLHLERKAAALPCFVMGATGKNQLLARIEAIVGLAPKMPTLQFRQFTGLLGSVVFILALHSLLVVAKKNEDANAAQTLAHLGNPFNFVYQDGDLSYDIPKKATSVKRQKGREEVGSEALLMEANYNEPVPPPPPPIPAPDPHFLQVGFSEAPMAQLTAEEQQHVAATIETTKKVLSTLEWKKLEHSIADVMTEAEKKAAFEQYRTEVEQLNWEQVEDNLASRYAQTDWEHVNQYMNAASFQMHIDSVEAAVSNALIQLNECSKNENLVAFPDQPLDSIKAFKTQITATLDSIKAVKLRPVVRF